MQATFLNWGLSYLVRTRNRCCKRNSILGEGLVESFPSKWFYPAEVLIFQQSLEKKHWIHNIKKIFWFGIHHKIHRLHFSVEPVDLIHQTKVFQISCCKIMVCYNKVEATGTLPRGNRIKRCESVVRVTHDGTISKSTHLVLKWNILFFSAKELFSLKNILFWNFYFPPQICSYKYCWRNQQQDHVLCPGFEL